MGESSTVKAQRLANESNERIAKEANEYNKMLMEMQNQWNLEQWNRENVYNDPSAQLERYIKAGINPIYALGQMDNGNAQQLTSAPAHPAQVAHMEPEYDPFQTQRVGNILAAAQNVANDAMGFYKLALENRDVGVRERAQASQEALNRADVAFKKSQTAGQDFLNNLNLKTADSLIGIKQREYENLGVQIENARKQGQNIDELTANARETRNQIIAMTDYTKMQADNLLTSTRQKWVELSIQQQNANTSQFQAQSQSYYQGQELKQRGREFQFDVDRVSADLKSRSNDQLIKFYGEKRGYLGRLMGNLDPTDQLTHFASPTTEKMIEKSFVDIQAVGQVLYDRYKESPTQDNYKSYMEWQNSIQDIPQVQLRPDRTFPVTPPSVLNPSDSWSNQ